MRRRRRFELLLQVVLVLVTSLFAIATNFATNGEHVSGLLRWLQRISVPATLALVAVLVVGQVIAFRLGTPPPPARSWDRRRTPYPGLDAFSEDEAAVFFGRDVEALELVQRLHASPDRPAERFVPLVGASGSGKSSLVRAGVIPRLRERRWLVLPVATPGSNPVGALAAVLAEEGKRTDASAVLRRIRRSPDGLALVLAELRRSGPRHRRVLLVIDQFEELVTLAGDRDRALFLEAIAEALRRDRRLWVLATLRIEFLRDLLNTGQAGLFQNPVAIGALTRSRLAQIVERPAELVDLRFGPGLVGAIVDDAETTDALPLLAYLLQELYFAAGAGGTITEDAYHAHGGVAGALARQADLVMAELNGQGGVEKVVAVLLKFVTVDGQDATRRRVPLDELTPGERAVVDAFVDARLLVTDLGDGRPHAQVAHEALFRQWPPLRQEVEARIEQLRQRAELERWAVDWERAGRSRDYLLTGDRLVQAESWYRALEQAGQAPAAAEGLIQESKRRDVAFLRRVSEGIGEYVIANAEQHPELSVLLSLAALSECPPTSAAVRALLSALTFSHLSHVLKGHGDVVRGLAWSPDGQKIVTASRDGTARIWDAATAACLTVLRGHGGSVEMAAWAPDSRRVATASRDDTVRVWNAETGETRAVLREATDAVRAVAWSPDGCRIAAGSRDLVVRVWDADTYALVTELTGHTDSVLDLAFSPDGVRLATGSHDRTVRIWNLRTGGVLPLRGHEDLVEGVAWTPDGKRLASASGDQSVRVWDAGTGRQSMLMRGHTDRVWNVAWSPDGSRLATCGADRTARVWNPGNAEEVFALRGHTGDVCAVSWSPDGARIATASADGTGRIWDIDPRGGELLRFAGHRAPVRALAYRAPSERHRDKTRGLLVTGSDDHTLRIWDVETSELVEVLDDHRDAVLDVSLSSSGFVTASSDGTLRLWPGLVHGPARAVIAYPSGIPEAVADVDVRFASAGRDRTIRIWNITDGSPVAVLHGHQDWVVSLAAADSGRWLASASDDRTVRIWDMLALQEFATLRGHANWVDAVAWSPDERFVVSGSADLTARIWEVASGRQIAVLSGHEARVHAVAWSPDGTRIATASYDRTVRVWDARDHTENGVVGVHRDKVTSVVWTADSTGLITGSYDGTARLWNADPDLDALQAAARRRVFRALTDEERRTHLLPLAEQ
ncbi:WD40 repeat domain-containing protein [Actinomadura gamaensis]|uniref:WD40 repeat domain-containing protein n=1 Tax=Actinomadura gamaensis TaxID=1763541 RepID=A0ABV9TZ80_9ACTN